MEPWGIESQITPRLRRRFVPQGGVPVEDLRNDWSSRADDSRDSGVGGAWYRVVVSFEVDVTLIQEMLALTPTQRIQQNDRVLRTLEELRDGLAKSGKSARDVGLERR